jgi:hypothetical protein
MRILNPLAIVFDSGIVLRCLPDDSMQFILILKSGLILPNDSLILFGVRSILEEWLRTLKSLSNKCKTCEKTFFKFEILWEKFYEMAQAFKLLQSPISMML